MSQKEASDNMGQGETRNENDLASDSRRRLLKLGTYIPPAIIGMAIINSAAYASDDKDKDGGGNGSCNPNACNPCLGGGKTKRDKNKDERDCRIAQKKRS